MDKLLEILQQIDGDVDFRKEKELVTRHILDSIDITLLISELEEKFDIEIGMEYMDDDNFNSLESIWKMIREIQEG